MVGRQVVFAPCKINLHLGIHAQTDSRGYHRVDSVMMPVGLFDEVTVDDAPAFVVHHEPAIETPPQKTTVWKAATLLAEELGAELNLRIDVKARIPEKAGLGGSSADAGAALRALCERWGVDVHDPRVADVARRVGADVSFFLDPVPSLFLGAGDVLTETFPALPMPVVLVKPTGDGVSAAAAYGEYDRNPSEPPAYGAMCAALRRGSAEDVRGLACNNLAPAAKALQPASEDAQKWLASQPETRMAMVSGSGSCVFALCETIEEARAVAARAADEQDWWSFATLTVGKPEEVC